jgi:hypothetical protein
MGLNGRRAPAHAMSSLTPATTGCHGSSGTPQQGLLVIVKPSRSTDPLVPGAVEIKHKVHCLSLLEPAAHTVATDFGGRYTGIRVIN